MRRSENAAGRAARTRTGALALLAAAIATCAHGAGTTLVPAGATWRFLDNGTNQGTNWTKISFADSGWSQGPAQLGYGDGDEATVVSFGAVATNKHVTTYFRRAFVVTNPAAFLGLSLEVLRDDGVVIHLNGREVARENMPGGTISNRTRAVSAVSGAGETAFIATYISPTNLLAGTNVFAVEIHQSDAASSDASFDLRLSGVTQASLVRGPYLQIQTRNSAVIRWRTDFPTDSRVAFGTNPSGLTNFVALPARTNEHIVQVGGLAQETRYYYSIGTSNAVLASGTNCFFTTAPPAGSTRPVRIWAIGDSGTGDDNARAVRDAYLNFAGTRPADVWLMLGDNAYDAGTDAEFQAAVFDMYPAILRNTFVWPTIGNHETDQSHTATSFPHLDIFSLPTNGAAGGLASGTEKYYSFDFAGVHFVCLDSMTSDCSSNAPMTTWLRADLQTTPQQWKIAYFHHPPYTKGSHDSDIESDLLKIRTNALPSLEALGVDLVLTGHSHAYERSYHLHGHYGLSTSLTTAMKHNPGDGRVDGDGAYHKTVNGSGTVYVVAGSSGKISGGPLDHPAMYTSLNELGSVIIDIASNRLDSMFITSTGAMHDHFTILKDNWRQPGPPHIAFGVPPPGGGAHPLQFTGDPNTAYRIEYTEDLASPHWQLLTNITADASGNIQFTPAPTPAPSRIFRTLQP